MLSATTNPPQEEEEYNTEYFMALLQQPIVMVPLELNYSVQFPRARELKYFVPQYGMELNSTPYKYNLQITTGNSCDTLARAMVRIELMLPVKDSNASDITIEKGVIIEKQLSTRRHSNGTSSSNDSASREFRIAFLAYSYMYQNSLMYLNVFLNQQLVYTSDKFLLLARKERKRTKYTNKNK